LKQRGIVLAPLPPACYRNAMPARRLRRIPAALLALAVAAVAEPPTMAAEAPADWSRAVALTVVMTEYSFTPDHLRFHQGQPYRLRLENRGKEMHEFTAPEFFKAIAIRNPEVLVAAGNDVVVQPGEQKELDFVPRQRGEFGLICADHDWAGMIGGIVIE
jgi:uncharacterized cupredoxin-like copper-binding protein